MDIAVLLGSMPPLEKRDQVRRVLLSPEQPVFEYVKQRVAAEDVVALRVLRDDDTPLHRLLKPRAAAASSVRSLVGHEPFQQEEPAAVQALRASAAMGLALVGEARRSVGELRVGLLWLHNNNAHARLESADAQALLDEADAGHANRLRRLLEGVPSADADLTLPALIWLLALDDALPEPRPVGEVSVLFDDGRGGVRGTLTGAVLPEGPPALLPDPRTMSGFRGDERFRQSLHDAWAGEGQGVSTTVLWSLTHGDGVVGMVEDNSLGCAFAVLLGEAERAGRRLRPPALRRVNPRTALVGGLDAGRPGVLVSVGGYEAKLKAAGEGTNVVVPAVDRQDALRQLPGGNADRLLFAATVNDAARQARVWDYPVVKRWGSTVVAVLVALLLISLFVVDQLNATSEAEARKALASDLAAEAMLLREADPRLAGLLGLAGYTIEPDTPRAVQAMRDVLEANSGVRMSWRASPAEVTSIAVDDERGRVYTTGDDPYLKAWDLLTGKEVGRVDGRVTDLVLHHESGLLAARDDTAVSVYSAFESVPQLMGRLPVPSCGGEESTPVATAFANGGVRLVEVRDDGAVAQYDTTTLEEISCRRIRDLASDEQIIPGGSSIVIDASAAPGLPPELAGELRGEDKALLLLTSGDVMALGLDSHKLTTEIGSSDLPGRVLQIGATDTEVLLASVRGVQAWDRRKRRPLAYPVGGLAYTPRAMAVQSGSVVIAGDNGTALIPIGTGYDSVSSRDLEEPRGGPADVAAVGDSSTMVVGGPGGRVNVLDRRPGPLSLAPAGDSVVASFSRDGLLLLAHGSFDGSAGVYAIDPSTTPKITREPWSEAYRTVADYSSETFDIRAVAVSGSRVAAAGRFEEQAVVVVWDRAGQAPTRTLHVPALDRGTPDGSDQALTAVAFVPGKPLLVARHATGPLAIWSTTTWKLLATVDLGAGSGVDVHGRQALALEQSGEDGRRVALVDLTTHKTRTANAPGAEHVAWSHDGSRIAVLGRDNTVRYRNAGLTEMGEPLVLPAAIDAPTALTLSPDGGHIAIAVGDKVIVHETSTGLRALPTLHSSSSPGITGLSWSPDGEFLAAVTQPIRDDDVAGPVSLWRVDSIDWRSQICQWTGGSGLSTKEWRTHIGDDHAYIDLCAETK